MVDVRDETLSTCSLKAPDPERVVRTPPHSCSRHSGARLYLITTHALHSACMHRIYLSRVDRADLSHPPAQIDAYASQGVKTQSVYTRYPPPHSSGFLRTQNPMLLRARERSSRRYLASDSSSPRYHALVNHDHRRMVTGTSESLCIASVGYNGNDERTICITLKCSPSKSQNANSHMSTIHGVNR